MNYREVLQNAAARARLEYELAHDQRHDARTWWRNRCALHRYGELLLKHLKGKAFPDPRRGA